MVNISVVDSNSYEAFVADKMSFQIQRIGATNSELFVEFDTLAGTAAQDIDYSALNGGFLPSTLYLAPGETSLTITIEPFEDSIVEGDETGQRHRTVVPTSRSSAAPAAESR